MNLSFSTRGWPDLSWDDMIETALEMGFTGIEVYNLPKFDPMLEKGGPFHKHKVAATVRQLRDLVLEELTPVRIHLVHLRTRLFEALYLDHELLDDLVPVSDDLPQRVRIL